MWFKLIDRNKANLLVLIPGWACDYRIFDSLDLDFNYLIPIEFQPFGFDKALLKKLKEMDIKRVSLLGFSLGGFVTAHFVCKYPDLVDKVILVSVKKRYDRQKIEKIKNYLKANKKGFLYQFYMQCFYKKEKFYELKDILFKRYCEEFNLDYLLSTLDYLEHSQINSDLLNNTQKEIKIIHGEYDNIVNLEEAEALNNSLKNSSFIVVKDAGHIPFLEATFLNLNL